MRLRLSVVLSVIVALGLFGCQLGPDEALGPDAAVDSDPSEDEELPGSLEASAPSRLRVVTANISFALGPKKVKADFAEYSTKADIILVQEARDVKLKNLVDTKVWAVRQNVSSSATRGSAILVRKSIAKSGGIGKLRLIKGVGASSCPGGGIGTRYIARVNVALKGGPTVKLASVHMPPKRCWGPVYNTMANRVVSMVKNTSGSLIVGGDWNKKVRSDPNNIRLRTGRSLKIRAPKDSIDGFYFRPSARLRSGSYKKPALQTVGDAKRLAKTHSDHRPVRMIMRIAR